eukprot:s30_g29.t1
MRLVLLCGLFFAPKAAAQCPQVPPAGLLPNEAVQDCGSATSEGVVCPFNCSNAFSHSGYLRCLSGTWQVDSNDPPRCIQPCYSASLVTGYGQRAAFLGYLNGFWASPTEAITTTTLLSCDVLGAQSCLQTVVGITDIQEFCSRLPGATTCLKAAECCESSAATIRSSINSCAEVGRVVENPCVDSTGERCSSQCVPPTLGSDATEENCAVLRRVPFCMRSQSCCDYWLQGLGLADLAVSCRQLGINISDACEGDQLPYVSNEGAQVQVTCQTPRYASSTASMAENYTCQNSSFHLTAAGPALQCLDPPCPLDPHPSGSYECTLDGQSITLTAANGVLQVPFGASCTLRCSQSHELPVPPETLQCVYVESDFTDIIYADSSQVTSTGVPRMVRRFTNSSLVPAVQQVCEAMDCPLPVLPQPVALNGNISQAGSEIDGMLYVDCNGLSHGSSCSPVCAVGFMVDPLRASLRCDVGRFQGHVRCVQRRCAGAPVWGFGDVGSLATWPSPCVNALHGESCEASCASGYMRDPSVASYTCEAGEWTAPTTSPCVESSCAKMPVVSNAAALQACANRPHGYECPVRCNSGYTQLGSVRCNKGSYLASGLVCIPQGLNEELQSESVDAIRAQILFVKTPRLVSLQGRVHVAANAALALDPDLEPQQLATKLAQEMDVSAPDLSLALSTLASVAPSFALRAALATAPQEVSSIVILAMARFEALDLWSNVSHILVGQGSSTALPGFSAALAPFATAPAAAMAALARDAGDVLQRDLDLQRFFQLLGVGSSAAIATAQRQFDLTDGVDPIELQNLRLSVLGSFRDLPGAVDVADFRSKVTAALSDLDLEDTLSSSNAAAAAAADVAVRQVVPTAMEDVTAAAAMVTVQQMRSACVGTPSSCQRETSIGLLEAGREAQRKSGRMASRFASKEGLGDLTDQRAERATATDSRLCQTRWLARRGREAALQLTPRSPTRGLSKGGLPAMDPTPEELTQLGTLQAVLDWAEVSQGVALNVFEELGHPASIRDVVFIPRETWDASVLRAKVMDAPGEIQEAPKRALNPVELSRLEVFRRVCFRKAGVYPDTPGRVSVTDQPQARDIPHPVMGNMGLPASGHQAPDAADPNKGGNPKKRKKPHVKKEDDQREPVADFLNPDIRRAILEDISQCQFDAVFIHAPFETYTARKEPWGPRPLRSPRELLGLQEGLTAAEKKRLEDGNAHTAFVARVMQVCHAAVVPFVMEGPEPLHPAKEPTRLLHYRVNFISLENARCSHPTKTFTNESGDKFEASHQDESLRLWVQRSIRAEQDASRRRFFSHKLCECLARAVSEVDTSRANMVRKCSAQAWPGPRETDPGHGSTPTERDRPGASSSGSSEDTSSAGQCLRQLLNLAVTKHPRLLGLGRELVNRASIGSEDHETALCEVRKSVGTLFKAEPHYFKRQRTKSGKSYPMPDGDLIWGWGELSADESAKGLATWLRSSPPVDKWSVP